MELKNQVTNLELSKKLKSLSYPQEGLFWWCWYKQKVPKLFFYREIPVIRSARMKYTCVAPTVAELGGMMKGHCITNWTIEGWTARYPFLTETQCPSALEKTEVNARAKMLIYLMETGLLYGKN